MKIRYSIIYIALIVSFLSCSDEFLTKDDPNKLNIENFWSDMQQSRASVTACYSPLSHQMMYGRYHHVFTDGRSDQLYTVDPSGDRYELCNFGMDDLKGKTFIKEYWRDCYVGIYRCNLVLENIDKTPIAGNETASMIEEMKGEAYFLRAFYYYTLITNFRTIPLIIKTPFSNADYFPAQANRVDVWEQIFKDYIKASELLPEIRTGKDLGRATKGAANVHLGRAYMFYFGYDTKKADVAKVELAKKAFESVYGKYSLVADYSNNFKINTEHNAESVFEICFAEYVGKTGYALDDVKNGGQMRSFVRGIEFAPVKPTGNWSGFQPTQTAFRMFTDTTEVAGRQLRFGKRDPRMDATFHFWKKEYRDSLYMQDFARAYRRDSLTAFGWKKYQMSTTGRVAERVNNTFPGLNFREFRYAEVILYLAECEAIVGSEDKSIDYINEVRNRVKVVKYEKNDINKSNIMNLIEHERFVELCGEGKRWHDLLRWNKTKELYQAILTKEDSQFLAINNTTYPISYAPERLKSAAYKDGKHDFFPIPEDELRANFNLIQDEFYK